LAVVDVTVVDVVWVLVVGDVMVPVPVVAVLVVPVVVPWFGVVAGADVWLVRVLVSGPGEMAVLSV
jgi:hypothetical protein